MGRFDTSDESRALRPYLLAIAHNVRVDWLRRMDREGATPAPLPPDVAAPPADPPAIEADERWAVLRDALCDPDVLTRRELTFFLLSEHCLGKLSQNEIAFWLKASPSTVSRISESTTEKLKDYAKNRRGNDRERL